MGTNYTNKVIFGMQFCVVESITVNLEAEIGDFSRTEFYYQSI